MHKLTRPEAPTCLSEYQNGLDNWQNVSPEHKSEIWLMLDDMQQHRCAYCECEIKTGRKNSNAHIEHFRQRRSYSFPQGTFEWSNLFGSCNKLDSCGKHKDALPAYAPSDLIKMDEEDPEHFLEFQFDGSVVPKTGLSSTELHRAKETIRIFNLNGSLRQIRKREVHGYKQTAEEFADMAANFDREDWLPLLEQELKVIANLPFSTAIKHALLPA